ncbi:MAG: hypothetical protein SFH39_03730, partial [Candidatus Magnetobacterium sp. LHC-1]
MRVLLLNPPCHIPIIREGRCQSPQSMRKSSIPQMTMAYLASVLTNEGHTLNVYDCIASNLSKESIFSKMDKFQPQLAIINTTTPSINSDMVFVEEYKKRYKDCFVAIFG